MTSPRQTAAAAHREVRRLRRLHATLLIVAGLLLVPGMALTSTEHFPAAPYLVGFGCSCASLALALTGLYIAHLVRKATRP